MIALTAGLALLLAAGNVDEITIYIDYNEQDGMAARCGTEIDLFGGGATLSGAGGIAAGLQGLRSLDSLLSDAFSGKVDKLPKLPKTTGETVTQMMSTPVAGMAATIPPTTSSYFASVEARLTYDDARRAYVVKSGGLQWSASGSGKMKAKGHFLYDNLSGEGSYALKRDDIVVTFKDGSAKNSFDPGLSAQDTTYRLKLNIRHPATLTGESGWIVDGGRVMSMKHRYGEQSTDLKIVALGESPPVPPGPPCRVDKGISYDASERELKDREGSYDETWLSPVGSFTFISWSITAPFQLKYHQTGLDVALLKYGGNEIDAKVLEMVAGGGSSWLPHANFQGEVLVDGVNQVKINTSPGSPTDRDNLVTSSGYEIDRQIRVWDPPGSTSSAWLPDNKFPTQDWLDNPAVSIALGPPDSWGSKPPNKGTLDEFLVKVKDHPEFGFMYVAFVMEIRGQVGKRPPGYRIKYSDPESIDAKTYKQIRDSGRLHASGLPFGTPEEGWVDLVKTADGKWTAKPRP
ncbi:MAG TPA: hypothetical protein VN461_14405 [Vicinamibacteria bacterium]|jgi:hypothetical protein|nr:hypothetical protein [Vicinamibacteria bacterium]